MQCFDSKNSDQVTFMKEYNMWSDNIWKDLVPVKSSKSQWTDIPRSPASSKSSRSATPEWVDAETTSPIPSSWSPPKKSQSSSSEFKWDTPPKSENPSFDLDSSPRTSTPVFESSIDDLPEREGEEQYECFKIHLQDSPRNLKVRGAVVYENESIISGHIDMKNIDPFSYTFEENYLPGLNYCFLNLLLNGPVPLMCEEHYDPKYPNDYVSNCNCLPVCNCRASFATNRNLPIGYKYNEDGHIVPSMPTIGRFVPRKPNCIYTH